MSSIFVGCPEEVSMEPSEILGALARGNTIKRLTQNQIQTLVRSAVIKLEVSIWNQRVFRGDTVRGEIKVVSSIPIKNVSVFLRVSCILTKEPAREEEEKSIGPIHKHSGHSFGSRPPRRSYAPSNPPYTSQNILPQIDFNEMNCYPADQKSSPSIRVSMESYRNEAVLYFQKSLKLFSCERDFPLYVPCWLPFAFKIPNHLAPSFNLAFLPQEEIKFASFLEGGEHGLQRLRFEYKLSAFLEESKTHKLLANCEMVDLPINPCPEGVPRPPISHTFQLGPNDFSSSLIERVFCSCSSLGVFRVSADFSKDELRILFQGDSFKSETVHAFRMVLQSKLTFEGKTYESELWDSICLPCQGQPLSIHRTIKLYEISGRPVFQINDYTNENLLKIEALYNEEFSMRKGIRKKEVLVFPCDFSLPSQERVRETSGFSTFRVSNLSYLNSSFPYKIDLPFSRADPFTE